MIDQDLAASIDRLAAALIDLERLHPSRIGPSRRIELLWASEQLRSLGATPLSNALSADPDFDWVTEAADANRQLATALDETGAVASLVELHRLSGVLGTVDTALAACDGVR